MPKKDKELNEGELEKAAGGLKARQTNEPARGSEEPLKVRQADPGTDPDPGHIDP